MALANALQLLHLGDRKSKTSRIRSSRVEVDGRAMSRTRANAFDLVDRVETLHLSTGG